MSIFKAKNVLIPMIILSLIINSFYSSTALAATNSKDRTPPTIPTGLKVLKASEKTIAIAWKASKDNVKVKKYEVYQNGVRLGATTSTSYLVTGLSSAKTYQFMSERRMRQVTDREKALQ